MPLTPADVPPHIVTEFRAPSDLLKEGVAPSKLYDWHATENPNYPLFTYQDGDVVQFITYSVANRAINRAAHYIAASVGARDATVERPIVAVLANADTITYFCNIIGILRAGCTLFLMSPRNGAEAVADMLQRSRASQLLLTPDVVIRQVAEDALSRLPAGQITMRDMPMFEDLFPSEQAKSGNSFEWDVQFPDTFDLDSCAIILHSSGSTDYPKLIPWSHRRVTAWGQDPTYFEGDTSRSVFGCHGVPLFHAMGTFLCSAAPVNGYVIAAFRPAWPPVFPTPEAVWEGSVATKTDYFFTVPSNIEEWSRDLKKIPIMRRARGFVFGGAPLNSVVGDDLAAQGVSLFPAYGMTEIGSINENMGAYPGMDWAYWAPVRNKEFRFIPRGENKFEVVVLSDPNIPLPIININIDGRDGYATNDLVEPHPTKPNYWKVYGRADEQIILSNGEKTNPLPLEKIINQDPHVKCSMMFGSGKFQNGILIEPKEQFAIDPSDVQQVEKLRNDVWPSVERANERAPQHSRIFKEMILITSPSKPLQLNMKGLPRRKAVLAEYQDEIEALYQQVEDSAQRDLHPPTLWDEQGTLTFVRTVIKKTLRRSIGDEADFFRNGCDSLQTTWIRNTVLRAIRETDPAGVNRMPMDFVFRAPTISALAHMIHNSMSGAADYGAHSHAAEDLWKYVVKHSAGFPERHEDLFDRPTTGKDVILITGTTGGFGCDTLEHLLQDDAVERVYAFNRKNTDALERQRAQFRARGLDESLLDSPKFRMVEATLHEPGFGLESALLEEIRQSVTHILHNAWRVDFKLSIQSFEMDIQGARNLVDLAISSPYRRAPTVVFVSSIGVFTNYKGVVPAPEAPLNDPASPFGVGYSESKWVTEHVLQNATEQRGVHAVIVRLGQVCGDRTGHWNEKEWFPALVKSAQSQGCLPDVEGDITWVPGYEGAKAFAEMRHSPEPFLHLVHPKPVPWHTIIAPIAEELGASLVAYDEWLIALRKSIPGSGSADEVEQMKANPALRLTDFFRVCGLKMSLVREPMGTVYLSTVKSTQVSGALANLAALDTARVKQWLAAWKRSGFLT
ncbi:acetyl-CoA synthetase-like protein [Trametes coccinea BRFM310]|uniref:Acetyl-CoA synthetase-like protein n=1 Tax=Trametes coccinea (strain BRFM310) TaxID=1353009 RepID=A0A1Y2IK02_TRAC3|nr:acetyl-CoA synthetase-like protein [Trametes coccinea BRFM310]